MTNTNPIKEAFEKGLITRKQAKTYFKFFYTKDIKDKLAEKAKRFSYIYSKAENGFVVPITEGCDCDGVQYKHIGQPVKAVPLVLEKAEDEAYEWADGTMDIYYEKPSIALKMKNVSIDRTAEAFENGHSHSIILGSI